ncbi:MAG: RAD55 family ATPase [Candidatus Hecatellaceae archaeon]
MESRADRRNYPVISTEIAALDRLLGGGFPDGSVIILMGEPGSGFDLFAQQIMYLKASRSGKKVVYFSIDRPAEDVKSEMAIYGWDVDVLVKRQADAWKFVDAYTPRQEVRRGMTGRRVIAEILTTQLPVAIEEGRYAVIDTFSYILLFYELKDIIEIIEMAIFYARRHGGLHFFLVVPGLHDSKTLTTVAHFADGLIEFHLNPEEEEAAGAIKIRKLRKVHHVLRSIPYRITSEGISIETTMRVA